MTGRRPAGAPSPTGDRVVPTRQRLVARGRRGRCRGRKTPTPPHGGTQHRAGCVEFARRLDRRAAAAG
ncbi:MAG: hypothetical protein ACK55I_41635 [bacterium]